MQIEIEDIKALEPGKIYVVALDIMQDVDAAMQTIETMAVMAKDFGIQFIFVAKDTVEFISVPEGYEITKK